MQAIKKLKPEPDFLTRKCFHYLFFLNIINMNYSKKMPIPFAITASWADALHLRQPRLVNNPGCLTSFIHK